MCPGSDEFWWVSADRDDRLAKFELMTSWSVDQN